MRKKSKYKPKGVRVDAVNWVLSGLRPISSVGDAVIVLKAKNHSALTEVVQGRGNRTQIDVLIHALNVCEAYAIHGKGKTGYQRLKRLRTLYMQWQSVALKTSGSCFVGLRCRL